MARTPRSWFPLLAAFVGVVAAVTIASVLLGERSERVERADLEEAAGDFAVALLSYDSANLEAARARMRPLATDKFFANYEATLAALAEVNSKAEGRASEILVGRTKAGRAAVVVVTESTAQTANGPRANRGTYLRLELVLRAGGWRVDQVVELAAGRSEGAEPPSEE
ncbi:MAG TPA: hypothetical protein VMY88_03925 [Acidimicrobiales bacterium]|nr:hypothetical protein [Acidimicrobiales bacterium]